MSKLFSLGDLTASFSMSQITHTKEAWNNTTNVIDGSTQTTAKLVHFNPNGSCVFMTQQLCVKPFQQDSDGGLDASGETLISLLSNNASTILPAVKDYLVDTRMDSRLFGNSLIGDDDFTTTYAKIVIPTRVQLGTYSYRGLAYSYFTNSTSRSIGSNYVLDDQYYYQDSSGRDFSSYNYQITSSGSERSYTGKYNTNVPDAGVPLIFTVA